VNIESAPSGSRLLDNVPDNMDKLHRDVIRREQSKIETRIQQIRQNSTTVTLDNEDLKIIDIPHFRPLEGRPNESLAALQEWEGVVTALEDDVIYVDLIDITARQRSASETAEIPINEIAEEDRHRVVPGGIFRWVIGFTRKATGGLARTSLIYFRRASSAPSAPPPPFFFETKP